MDNNTKDKVEAQNETGIGRTLVNYRPVLFCAFFLAVGILSYKLILDGVSAWWLLLLLPLPCAVFLVAKPARKQAVLRVSSLLLCFFVGFGVHAVEMNKYQSGGQYNGEYFVCGRVVERIQYGNLCRVVLTDLEIDGNSEKGKLIAYLPYVYYDNIALCDELAVCGKVTREGLDRKEESYEYMVEENIQFKMSGESAVVIGYSFHLFPYLREHMQQVLFSCMDETTASVSLAILTGDISLIDAGLLDNVRKGGIAHIFAVSGLHIGALFAFALLLMNTRPFKRSSKLFRFVFVAVLLYFYGGICGYSASVIRAIITCLVLYGASLVGLMTDTGEIIGLAALVVLLRAPMSLFTIGFQLSFAACFGIAWLARPISKCWIKPIPVQEDGETAPLTLWQDCKRKFLSFLAVTLSAQIATTPIQLTAFGYFSGWSLLTNCLFVPLVSAVFSLFLLLVALSCLLPLAWASVLLYVPNIVWSAVLLVFETIDFSSFAITGICFGMGGMVLYYLLCVLFTDKLRLKKRSKGLLIIVTALALCITLAINSIAIV